MDIFDYSNVPFNYSSIPNPLGFNPFELAGNNPNLRINLNGISTTSPTVGAAGNLNGVKEDYHQKVLKFFSNPDVKGLPEAVQIQFAANPSLFGGNNELDLLNWQKQYGIYDLKKTKEILAAESARAERANEMARENLKLTNEMNRSNKVLGSLLALPGQISDTWARAATAGLPYQQEARQMMANTAANLQTGYTNLANMNTQFGNQVSNLFSNAASYRPTLIAGKYF